MIRQITVKKLPWTASVEGGGETKNGDLRKSQVL